MPKTTMGKEIIVKTVSEAGILLEISRTIAEKGISILALSGWTEGDYAIIHLVTDDNLRAVDALRRRKFDVREEKVVITEVSHKPGMLRYMAEKLFEENLDVNHIYASAPSSQDKCLIVFSSADNDRAVVVLSRQLEAARAF